jgi:hypothetical protein
MSRFAPVAATHRDPSLMIRNKQFREGSALQASCLSDGDTATIAAGYVDAVALEKLRKKKSL